MAHDTPPPIAIIGSACRLPGNASSPSKLWELLRNPRDLLKQIPRDRFHWEGFYRPDGLYGAQNTKDGYFLEENVREFDPHFFNILPAEAETLDPQHRLLLENVYEAIESAGLTLEDLQGSDTGVYVGMMSCEYYENATHDVDAASGQILTTGTSRAMASNRVSYTFDFRGPSMTIDTACSSSMIAVHLAVSSLRRGESKVAFSCGSHLNLTPTGFKGTSRMSMTSPDGRSKMFDEAANGYGRGEGVGVICLKRLDEAIKDGDYVECVIRETGTNQDGRTKGITVPSAEAQADLIRKTYQSAGLDPTKPDSRPSFFEAHGTGTLVGDPLEAQAIEAAFFPAGQEYAEDEVLYIGSIKTIVGHTEGTAGIAGLLRASLAVRSGVIPPNLLFNRMNPKVGPYAKHLRLVTAANPWPALPQGCPRRASVNSFGFGGSNVHVIVESYDNDFRRRIPSNRSLHAVELPTFTPFTFSATSETALISTMGMYLKYLKDCKDDICPRDLAWTLQYRRSQFNFRYAIPARTQKELEQKLEVAINGVSREGVSGISTRSSQNTQPRIMGIFTGQGAQWATMGRDLIDHSSYARELIEKLDSALSSLPELDRPQWKLKEELMINSDKSRVNEAILSQPLTTAIQILLVDLLTIAGVKLYAVVGHSSGEIAAAYAARLISAEDAIRIAYYRGFHSKLAAGYEGQSGAMLATFLTIEEAENFCNRPEFRDRIVSAAYNSPSIVTLSGDVDAIDLACANLEKENIFARKLQVDKAYHSHHMKPCADPYSRSLEQCEISPITPCDSPIWFSTVHPGKRMYPSQMLCGAYWVENLTSPVQFLGAVTTAISEIGVPDLFLEIGPHPVFERPVRQIIASFGKDSVAYSGMLKRGSSSIVSVSEALGSIWMRFGRNAVDFANYDMTLSNVSPPVLIKNLPTYPWQHDKEYWWENRFLRRRFQATIPPTELLGEAISMVASHENKWRCFLKPEEVPWVLDHKLNDLAVLPGAAYVVMATTAAQYICRNHNIELIEIQDIHFELPIVFPDEHTAIEIVITVVNIAINTQTAKADFFVDFCSDPRSDELMTAVRGKFTVRFGKDDDRTYPKTLPQHSNLSSVDRDYFYESLSEAGYGYRGPFRSITSLKRRMDFATGKLNLTPSEMAFHPAILDGLFQASFAADSLPGDSAMPNFRVPSLVRSIKIFPTRCEEVSLTCESLYFDVVKTGSSEYGGVLYSLAGEGSVIQMEGFATAPFRMSTPEDDLNMYCKVVWRPYIPNATLLTIPLVANAQQKREMTLSALRVALFYLRQLNEVISYDEEQRADEHLRHFLEFARLTLAEVQLGIQPSMKKEWLNDTEVDISDIVHQNPDCIDIQLLDAIGKAYPFIICRQQSALSTLMENDMLSKFYRDGLGFPEAISPLNNFVEALSSRSPNIRILEIGGGTGSVTEGILKSSSFYSYTFTDISPAFLGPAKKRFKQYEDKIIFQIFDMDKDPYEQGYEAGSFEVIVAANVLHASEDVKGVLGRIRPLLRPGGYLLCMELSANRNIIPTVIMGGLPGWWLGHGKDRLWSAALTEQQWDSYLQESGFSGIDAITPVYDELLCPYRVFCAQAIDDRVRSLRKPLSLRLPKSHDSLMIIEGNHSRHADLAQGVETLLSYSFQDVIRVSSLDDIKDSTVIPYAVLSLVDLDDPVFRDITATRWAALQRLLGGATDVLWVTTGAKAPRKVEAAYANMMTGLARTVRHELHHLRLTLLDVDDPDSVTAKCLSQAMLRWYMLGQWAIEGWHDEILFGHQNELAIENGVILAPSVVPSRQMNDRYNSRHRRITQDVKPYTLPVELFYQTPAGQYALREFPQAPTMAVKETTVFVKMLYSTLSAINIKTLGFLFLGLGVCKNGAQVVVLSETISSMLQAPRNTVFPCKPSSRHGKQYLHALAANIVAERVISAARSSGSLLVIASDPLCMSLLQGKAAECNKTVKFITSDPKFEPQRAIFIHYNSLDLTIRQNIPCNTSVFVNVSNRSDDEVLFKRVCTILSSSCAKVKSKDAIFSPLSSGYDCVRCTPSEWKVTAGKHLKEVDALPSSMYDSVDFCTVSPKDVLQQALQPLSAILDWTSANRVPVNIQPATNDVNFSPKKTYLIIGSSDIAQSICEWMIERGAKFFVVTSRMPSGLTGWAGDMASKGAFVDLHAADVTNANSVKSMIASVKAGSRTNNVELPPFGGVIHLGLVLKDAAFSTMSFEDLQAVTDVKAKGSLILHEQLLQENLDFFILTSSISYTVGNPGQANYCCSNGFMVGLAEYRRSIGLPASVVDLGRVTGIGYLMRTAADKANLWNAEDLRKMGGYPISEQDIHHIFAEAVLASPADSGMNPEIITGLRKLEPGMVPHIRWAKEPMFAHLLIERTADSSTTRKPQLSVREKLREEFASATTRTGPSQDYHTYEIIRSAFIKRLEILLQVDNIGENVSLVDLGIDSLVATDIGSWARKELRVQVPNSMIFGGASVKSIVEFALKHLDRGWVMLKNQGGNE